MAEAVDSLRRYMLRWEMYFGLAQIPAVWRKLDKTHVCRYSHTL